MEATCFTPFLEPWIGKFLALKAFHKSWCPGFLRQAFHSSYKSYKAEVVRTRVQIWYPASWIVLGKLFGWYNNVDKTTSHQPPQPAWCLDFFLPISAIQNHSFQDFPLFSPGSVRSRDVLSSELLCQLRSGLYSDAWTMAMWRFIHGSRTRHGKKEWGNEGE